MFIGISVCKKINDWNRMAAPAPASLPEDSVFCTMGHGCEFFMEEPNIHRVPPGCTFITLEECGITSMDYPRIMNAFQDPLLKDALRYPHIRQIREVLSEYFGVSGCSVIRVHREKTYYTNPFIDLWLPAGELIFKSGTYKLGHFPNETISLEKTPRELELGDNLEPHHLSPARVQYIYNGSVFPKADVAVNERSTIKLRYSELMYELGDGIYYFFVCRSPCEMPNYNPRWNINHPLELNTPAGHTHRNFHNRGKIRRALSKEAVRAKGDNHNNQYGKNENQIETKNGLLTYNTETIWAEGAIYDDFKRLMWYHKIYEALRQEFKNTHYEPIINKLLLEYEPKFPEIALPSEEVMSQEHDNLVIEQERPMMERQMANLPQSGRLPAANMVVPQGNIPAVAPVSAVVPVQEITLGFSQHGRSRRMKRKTHRKKANRRIRKQTRKTTR